MKLAFLVAVILVSQISVVAGEGEGEGEKLEIPWFNKVSELAEKKRRKIFEENFSDAVAILKMDEKTKDAALALPAEVRYYFCQLKLYALFCNIDVSSIQLPDVVKPYCEWPKKIQTYRKTNLLAQAQSRKKKLLKNKIKLIERALEVEDLDYLSTQFSGKGFLFITLLLPDDINLFSCGKYEVELRNRGRKSQNGDQDQIQDEDDDEEYEKMDVKTAKQVFVMVKALKLIVTMQRADKDIRDHLKYCEKLVEQWQDNPLLASYYHLLGSNWRGLDVSGDSNSKISQTHRRLHGRALRLYGDYVCSSKTSLVTNYCKDLGDFVRVYCELWAFYSEHNSNIYPIRDIVSYYDKPIDQYPSAYKSKDEIIRDVTWLRANKGSLGIIERHITRRIKPGQDYELPKELFGSPLWKALNGENPSPANAINKTNDIPLKIDPIQIESVGLNSKREDIASKVDVKSLEESIQKKPSSIARPSSNSSLLWWIAGGSLALVVIFGLSRRKTG